VVWKIRTNQELKGIIKNPDMIAHIKRWMKWLVHIIRNNPMTAKNSFESKPGVTRKMGRPTPK
jgi:hypothetical protein